MRGEERENIRLREERGKCNELEIEESNILSHHFRTSS